MKTLTLIYMLLTFIFAVSYYFVEPDTAAGVDCNHKSGFSRSSVKINWQLKKCSNKEKAYHTTSSGYGLRSKMKIDSGFSDRFNQLYGVVHDDGLTCFLNKDHQRNDTCAVRSLLGGTSEVIMQGEYPRNEYSSRVVNGKEYLVYETKNLESEISLLIVHKDKEKEKGANSNEIQSGWIYIDSYYPNLDGK